MEICQGETELEELGHRPEFGIVGFYISVAARRQYEIYEAKAFTTIIYLDIYLSFHPRIVKL